MAVHDGEPYLRAAIDSLRAQTFRDFELIVIDDGSTDDSAAIVRSIEDPRIRLVSNEGNLGLAASLNRGVAAARGEFIARLDADDIAMPERLARQVAFMDANPAVVLLGSWYVEMAADGAALAHRRLPTEHWDLRWHLCVTCPFVHSAVLWRRREVAEQVGRYDERLRYGEDFELWRRIAARFEVATLPAYLIRLRLHGESMTATYDPLTRAGPRLRAATAARLLGWPDSGEAFEDRVKRLYDLLIGTPRGNQEQLLDDAAQLLRLHEAFALDAAMPGDVASRQRAELRTTLARRLLRASRVATGPNGRRGASRQLLRAVAALAPGALLSPEAVGAGMTMVACALGRS
jgi:hypothetical protein